MYVRGVCVSIFDVWVNVLVILVILRFGIFESRPF